MKQVVALLLALVMSSVLIVNAQGTEKPEEVTVRGTVIQNIQGVAVDAHNELLLATEAGMVRVLVMEGGYVVPEMAAQQCNQNQVANEASWNLKPGDVVEVFGKVLAEGEIEVCSDLSYSVTLLETTIRGTVVENIQDVVDDASNVLILETETGEIHVFVMESGLATPDPAVEQCDQNQAANEASWELEAGDVVEVFGRVMEMGWLEVCSDERYSISLVEEATIRGTVVENIQGIAFDGNNELILETENGEVRVLVLEGGLVTPEMAAQQCNRNLAVNEATWDLKAGDVVEVFGRVVAEGEIEVCSDLRYSITLIEAAS